MDYEHADCAGELAAIWRVIRAMLLGAAIGLLAFGGWWAATKTLHGITTYNGEFKG